jgi:hypothetical protein
MKQKLVMRIISLATLMSSILMVTIGLSFAKQVLPSARSTESSVVSNCQQDVSLYAAQDPTGDRCARMSCS